VLELLAIRRDPAEEAHTMADASAEYAIAPPEAKAGTALLRVQIVPSSVDVANCELPILSMFFGVRPA
jgi:hypothetical protein